MATLDTIRRITVQGRQEGVKDLTRDLKDLKNAQDGVASSSEKTNRAQLGVSNALDRQRRSLDSAYRAQQDLEKAQKTLDRGLQQGLLNRQEHNRLLELARQRAEDVTNGTEKMNSAFQRLQNSITRRFIFAVLINEMRDVVMWAARLPSVLANVGASARRLGVGAVDMQGYEGAAAAKGIDTNQFLSGAQGLAAALNDAKTQANDLYRLFQLNGGQAKTFEEALLRVADMVKNARNEQDKFNYLMQAGLPATAEWVRFMEQGADKIRMQAAEFKKYAADDAMIAQAQKFDDAWKKAWANFSLYARSGAGAAVGWLQETFNKSMANYEAGLREAASKISDPNHPLVAALKGKLLDSSLFNGSDKYSNIGLGNKIGKGLATRDPKAEENALNLERQKLSLLGEIATATDQVRAKEIELDLAARNRAGLTKEQRDAVLEMTKIRAQEQETAIRVANGAATALEMQSTKERELALLVQRKILTQDQANESMRAYAKVIQETMERQEVFKAALPNLKQLEIDARSLRGGLDTLATGTMNNLTSAISDGIMKTKTWGEAFRNFGQLAIRALSELIIKLTIIAPLSSMLQGGLSGGGGLGSILGGVGKLFGLFHSGGIAGETAPGHRYIHPAYFENAPRFHDGGLAYDEVPAVLQRGEEVLRRDDPRHVRNGGGEGGGLTIVNHNDFRGVDPSMKAWTQSQIRQSEARTLSAAAGVTAKKNRDTFNYFNK